jgi:hypothetical protein
MLGRHARPCESFLVCIEDSELCFSWSFVLVFVHLFSVRLRGFEWVSPRISLRETWIDVSRIFVIDLVPLNAGKPLRFESFSFGAQAFGGAQRIRDSR